MTAIAAYASGGTVYMGGDSAAVEQGHYLTLSATPKVFERGPIIIGYTSSFAMGHALQHRMELPDGLPSSGDSVEMLDAWMAVPFMDAVRGALRDCGYLKTDSGREIGGQFLVGVRGQIYMVDDDFHALRQAHCFAAIGSGVSACLGALQIGSRVMGAYPIPPGHLVLHALEAAEACIATVRGPFTIIEGGKL